MPGRPVNGSIPRILTGSVPKQETTDEHSRGSLLSSLTGMPYDGAAGLDAVRACGVEATRGGIAGRNCGRRGSLMHGMGAARYGDDGREADSDPAPYAESFDRSPMEEEKWHRRGREVGSQFGPAAQQPHLSATKGPRSPAGKSSGR